MKALFALFVLALAVVASSQSTDVLPSPAELVCATDDDCSFTPVGCCGTATCSYIAMNVASAPKYKLNATNCALMMCPAIACITIPNVTCVKLDPSAPGVCTLKMENGTIDPLPGHCRKTGCSNAICSKEDVSSTCEFTCSMGCYAAATCVDNATASSGCSFVEDLTLLSCLKACENPVTGTDLCKIGGCGMTDCVPASSPAAAACTKPPVTCADSCNALYGKCDVIGMTDSIPGSPICGWTGTSSDLYLTCLAECGTVLPTEEPCIGLPCSDCVKKADCSFCHLSYATTNDPSLGTPTTDSLGFCASTKSSSMCATVDATGVVSSSTSCPVVTPKPEDPVFETKAADPTVFQAGVDGSASGVKNKFTIVIAMVVNLTSSDVKVHNIVKLFVDLIGAGTPSQADKDEVCSILKSTLNRLDARVPVAGIACQLDLQPTVKRVARYVASLSYPASSDNQQGSSSTLVASFAAVALAAVAALF